MANVYSDDQTILAQKRRALDRWARARPLEYFDGWAEDVTYFDDIGAHQRIDGIAAMGKYAAALEGKVPAHRDELIDPKVQVYGDVGVVMFRYEPFGTDGARLQRWKATLVYRRTAGEWCVVHAHWSMVKEP